MAATVVSLSSDMTFEAQNKALQEAIDKGFNRFMGVVPGSARLKEGGQTRTVTHVILRRSKRSKAKRQS